MLFVILFWIAILLIVMRLLTWVAKRHPKARDAAALGVEFGAAFAIAESLADVALVASGIQPRSSFMMNAVLFALVGSAAHFFASNTARSWPVVAFPFILVGGGVLAGLFSPPWRMLIGIALVALGVILGWLKSRQAIGAAGSTPSGEAAQA